jgi:hypothetical protein
MAVKVKELKDNLLIDVKVNKSYYLMLKSSLHFLFNLIKDDEKRAVSMQNVMKGEYDKMNSYEKTFYTLTLILAEIERVAKEENHYEEKEVLEPEDDGYIAPTTQE